MLRLPRAAVARASLLRSGCGGFFSTKASQQETFLTGTTSVYAEQLYEKYLVDPQSVHESWRRYFDNLGQEIPFEASAFASPTTLVDPKTKPRSVLEGPSDSLGVAHLIRAYQVNGHLAANLDPLATYSPDTFPYRPPAVDPEGKFPAELTIEYHGFDSQHDLDRSLRLLGRSSGGNTGYLEQLAQSPHNVTLRSVLAELRKTYTGTIGVEYMVRFCCIVSGIFLLLLAVCWISQPFPLIFLFFPWHEPM